MQYTLFALLAIAASAIAASPIVERNEFVARQANIVRPDVPVSAPAMTNANGDVLPFDTKNVYLDSVAKGL